MPFERALLNLHITCPFSRLCPSVELRMRERESMSHTLTTGLFRLLYVDVISSRVPTAVTICSFHFSFGEHITPCRTVSATSRVLFLSRRLRYRVSDVASCFLFLRVLCCCVSFTAAFRCR